MTKTKLTPDTERRALLCEILSFARPHDTPTERRFCREFLDPIDGMQRDRFGNRYLRIGTRPILWSSHVDTVAARDGHQELAFDPKNGILSLANGKPKQSLGADDGVGVWIMLHMIEAGIEGLYVFHRGEERGCLGSEFIARHTPELLDGIAMAIAFDRAGYSDIITHQSFGMTASDDFAWSFARELNRVEPSFTFRPDNTGVYTDTNTYAHLIPECTNVSVGYFNQHSCHETLDVFHAEALLDAMLAIELDKLAVGRVAGDNGWDYTPASLGRGQASQADLEEAVTYCPEAAAAFLDLFGVTATDLFAWRRGDEEGFWERAADEGDSYVPGFEDEREEADRAH